jgi:hypothetical protein
VTAETIVPVQPVDHDDRDQVDPPAAVPQPRPVGPTPAEDLDIVQDNPKASRMGLLPSQIGNWPETDEEG